MRNVLRVQKRFNDRKKNIQATGMQEEDAEEMGKSAPELGIYDARAWNAMYKNWLNDHNNYQNPGRHPDPKCPWNENPNTYSAKEYNDNQVKLRKQARENGLI